MVAIAAAGPPFAESCGCIVWYPPERYPPERYPPERYPPESDYFGRERPQPIVLVKMNRHDS